MLMAYMSTDADVLEYDHIAV